MSMMTDIIDALGSAGIPAYMPSKAPIPCREAAAIVTSGAKIGDGKTTGRKFFYVTACVPAARPNELSNMVIRVQDAMSVVKALRHTGEISAAEIDERSDAYIADIEYTALCSL